jgi:hypothetical protein
LPGTQCAPSVEVARHLVLGAALLLAAALSLAISGCSSTNSASAGDGGLRCGLGGGCSQTQICMGGIAGCSSNCQCLDGTWQAPCPTDLPETGSTCTAAGAYCGYTTMTNACGAANCYCQGGAWSCGPTCIIDASFDASADAESVVACTSVDDCVSNGPVGSTVFCCLDKACAYSGGASIVDCNDADVQLIEASKYDQSCTTDSDCIGVAEGNFCYPGANNCPTAAISVGAQAQYKADVAMTNAAICGGVSSCGSFTGPCCRGGLCSLGNLCTTAADAGAE